MLTPPKNEPNGRRQRTNQLEVYFREIGASVFSDYMLRLGAHIAETGSPTSLRFESDSWYTELLVFPEEAPRFCPRIVIGVLPEIGYMDRDRQVDILHTLPRDSALRRYNLEWRYSNAIEMQQVFERVRDELFRPYVEPYLTDTQRLRSLIGVRSGKINEEWIAEIDAHNEKIHRRNAEQAFKNRDYTTYVREMAKIPVTQLSNADRKRLEYASRRE